MWFTLRPYQVFLIASVLLVMGASSFASTEKPVVVSYVPETLVAHAALPKISARSYVIFDVATGRLLSAEKPDLVLPIASVTKLLTAATVLHFYDADTSYTIAESDLASHGRAGRLSQGETYAAHELLFPLLLESSNDAAAVFERETEGDIVEKMNTYAKELGATSLRVTDASGLSDGNVASAKDLATLTSKLFLNEPHLFDITQLTKRSGPYVVWSNNSPVIDSAYLGGKHGFTEAAKRTLIAVFNESFTTGTRAVGYVILGSEDLALDTAALRTFVKDQVTLE